ncbi:MAG TPA: hypothetical protein VE177_02560 [Candidatus Binatus sp.]|jgi:hypothetical protein|nr:hypothetical protein [Candidatus Binatus sp.]
MNRCPSLTCGLDMLQEQWDVAAVIPVSGYWLRSVGTEKPIGTGIESRAVCVI